MCLFLVLSYLTSVQLANSQTISSEQLNTLTDQKFNEAITNLQDFSRLPNDGNFKDQIENNMRWCDSVFTHLNFKTQTIKTDGAPLLYAEKFYKKSNKNILF